MRVAASETMTANEAGCTTSTALRSFAVSIQTVEEIMSRLDEELTGAQTERGTRVVPGARSEHRCRAQRRDDELLDGEIFYSLREAQVVIESWRRHYNQVRPHASLGYRAPEGRLATTQPWLYAAGQLMHILGLVWSGGYGVQRKVAGADQVLRGSHPHDPSWEREAEERGPQEGHRRQCPRFSDAHPDIKDAGRRFVLFPFVGDHPAWRSQPPLRRADRCRYRASQSHRDGRR